MHYKQSDEFRQTVQVEVAQGSANMLIFIAAAIGAIFLILLYLKYQTKCKKCCACMTKNDENR